MNQFSNVSFALPKWGNGYRNDGEAVIQVFTELPLGDESLEITMCRSNDAHVNTDLASGADLLDLALMQKPEQSHLQIQRHLSDLIQKNCAPFGHFHFAFFVTHGSGERPFDVAEKLRFEKFCR